LGETRGKSGGNWKGVCGGREPPAESFRCNAKNTYDTLRNGQQITEIDGANNQEKIVTKTKDFFIEIRTKSNTDASHRRDSKSSFEDLSVVGKSDPVLLVKNFDEGLYADPNGLSSKQHSNGLSFRDRSNGSSGVKNNFTSADDCNHHIYYDVARGSGRRRVPRDLSDRDIKKPVDSRRQINSASPKKPKGQSETTAPTAVPQLVGGSVYNHTMPNLSAINGTISGNYAVPIYYYQPIYVGAPGGIGNHYMGMNMNMNPMAGLTYPGATTMPKVPNTAADTIGKANKYYKMMSALDDTPNRHPVDLQNYETKDNKFADLKKFLDGAQRDACKPTVLHREVIPDIATHHHRP
jgi:hypothetical protein